MDSVYIETTIVGHIGVGFILIRMSLFANK
jgi:hypothetical protein